MYKIIKNNPVAKFFYKGNHTHPVRRTVVIVEQNERNLTGFELREGTKTRLLKNAPIKSYKKSNIAKVKELDKRRSLVKKVKNLNKTTFSRYPIIELIKNGI